MFIYLIIVMNMSSSSNLPAGLLSWWNSQCCYIPDRPWQTEDLWKELGHQLEYQVWQVQSRSRAFKGKKGLVMHITNQGIWYKVKSLQSEKYMSMRHVSLVIHTVCLLHGTCHGLAVKILGRGVLIRCLIPYKQKGCPAYGIYLQHIWGLGKEAVFKDPGRKLGSVQTC